MLIQLCCFWSSVFLFRWDTQSVVFDWAAAAGTAPCWKYLHSSPFVGNTSFCYLSEICRWLGHIWHTFLLMHGFSHDTLIPWKSTQCSDQNWKEHLGSLSDSGNRAQFWQDIWCIHMQPYPTYNLTADSRRLSLLPGFWGVMASDVTGTPQISKEVSQLQTNFSSLSSSSWSC